MENKINLKYGRVMLALFILLIFLYTFNFIKNKYGCTPPKTIIGTECCIPSKNFPQQICKDEEDLIFKLMLKAIQENIKSDSRLIIIPKPKVSFYSPKEYYLLTNVTIAGTKVPYYFFKSYNENIDVCNIRLNIAFNLSNFESENEETLKNKLIQNINKMKLSEIITGYGLVSEYGVYGYAVEYMVPERKIKNVLFINKKDSSLVMFTFSCSKENYDHFIKDFDDVTRSVNFLE